MHESKRTNPFIDRKPLTGGGREPFMARVRKALLRKDQETFTRFEEAPQREEALVRQVSDEIPPVERLERWQTRATGNGMTVRRAAPATVNATVDAFLREHKVGKVLLNTGELGEQIGIAKHLAGMGADVLTWGVAECRNLAFNCDASVTDCRAAMADTGSLLFWSDPRFGRSSTLVVPVHVVLLPESRILADLIDGLDLTIKQSTDRSDEVRLPSNVVVVNGPSKTADIEMNLVTGVHGPKYLYVVVIEGM